MPDQSIHDPDKLPSENTEVSVKDIAESISYFFAGSLLIWIVLAPKLPNAVVLEPMEWLTATIGALLVVAGFISLVIIPFQRRIEYSRRMLITRVKHHIGAIVFAITLFTLVVVVSGLRGHKPLYITGIVFLSIVMVMIIVLSWSRVLKDSVSLMKIPVSLNTLAIIMLFAGAGVRELVTVLAISLIFMVLALKRISEPTTSS